MELNTIEEARKILLANNEPYLATALLAKELQQNIHDNELVLKLGLEYLDNSNFEASKACFLELKKSTNSFESHFYLGKCFEKLNDTESALGFYLDSLLISTINMKLLFEAYKNIGNLYLKEKNIDIAEDFYHKAYALFPESPQLLVNLGTLEMQREDSSRAIERYRKALCIDPQFSPAWVGLALSYHQFGDLEISWASLLKAIEYDNKNSTALLLFAKWCTKHNAIEIALNHLMNFFDLGEFDTSLSLAFVELCIQNNKFYLARIELERALLWDPKQPDLLSFDKALSDHGF